MNKRKPDIFNWEKWPFNLIYFPLYFVWFYYIIRSKAVWFFTPSNPTITFGGLKGETKKEMYAQLPSQLYPATFNVQLNDNYDSIIERLEKFKIKLPCVVKPQIGEAGILFRKIDNLQQLQEYHSQVNTEFMVQNMISDAVEVSVFYYRMPNEKNGTISGFLHKVPMHVLGDGHSTLRQLILLHPKATGYLAEIEKKHAANMVNVLSVGEKYIFSYAANHRRGARFYNMQHEIDEKLHAVFDDISNSVDGWYFGRYDIMCSSIAELKMAQNFSILEYNGCGAEPNHIYDSGYTLGQAYKEIMKHWAALFRISQYNVRQGMSAWPIWKGFKFLIASSRQLKQMKKTDESLSF